MRKSIQKSVLGTRTQRSRAGAMALTLLIFYIFVMFGLIVITIDLGYILQTRTQLQAISDASTLSGGTELMSGLGEDPELPATVVAAGSTIAVEYAAKHRNGDQYPTYASAERDVHFGWAKYDTDATPPGWVMNWDEELPVIGGYNLIGTTIRRDQVDSVNGDGPLPLLFAPLIGKDFNNITADSAAVIMPATGIRIPPGNPTTANVMPFAVEAFLWKKYLRAQAWLDDHGGKFPNELIVNPVAIDSVMDTVLNNDPIEEGGPKLEPLFGHYTYPNGNDKPPVFQQDFADVWNCGCEPDDADSGFPDPAGTAGGDGKLEVDIFPRDAYTSGNLGTIDLGSSGNDTSGLKRQILDGPNESDMSYYTNNEIVIDPVDGWITNGDTGLSAGIKDALNDVTGLCRAVFLFEYAQGSGETTEFKIVDMAGIRVMNVELTGALDYKHLSIQRCNATLGGGTGDYEDPPGEHTTVFTPLILIE